MILWIYEIEPLALSSAALFLYTVMVRKWVMELYDNEWVLDDDLFWLDERDDIGVGEISAEPMRAVGGRLRDSGGVKSARNGLG